jgi:hypothetical protein
MIYFGQQLFIIFKWLFSFYVVEFFLTLLRMFCLSTCFSWTENADTMWWFNLEIESFTFDRQNDSASFKTYPESLIVLCSSFQI